MGHGNKLIYGIKMNTITFKISRFFFILVMSIPMEPCTQLISKMTMVIRDSKNIF